MLTKPIILKQSAFDATKGQTIRFNTIGGSQVVKNRLRIMTNVAQHIEIYNEEQVTYNFVHSIPANTLTNGTYYTMQIKTYDADGNESVWSDSMPFRCYSEPTLEFTNIPSDNIIKNSSYDFEITYTQAEGEKLKNYRYILYDNAGIELSTSGVLNAGGQNVFTYNFNGFDDNVSYKIQVTGLTVNDTIVSTPMTTFTADYISPTLFATLDLHNDCNNGWITINSNISTIEGDSQPSPPIYIDNKEIDLTGLNSFVAWNKGYEISGDFTMKIPTRSNDLYDNIYTSVGSDIIKLRLIENDDQSKIMVELIVGAWANPQYIEFSNEIDKPNDNEQLCILVRRIDNIYTVKLENRGVI